ncbi:MAG: hypothetical protein K1X85_00305, partial [Ignavibacteria bacterium]|nr:hypothetical protein [Ignavibacteria bacterium]
MKSASHRSRAPLLTNLLWFLSIFVFINAFNFQHNPPEGWYRQFLPENLPPLNNLTFKDSLTGYGVTVRGSDGNSYVIRTTNGGDNWSYVLTENSGRTFLDIEFINAHTGFAGTDWFAGARLYKTTDGGDNWNVLNNPNSYFSYQDIHVLSDEEVWATRDLPFDGGVFRTTNGGTTWQRKYYNLSYQADRVYMINSRIGFISNGYVPNSFLRKTTDAGDTWVEIPNGDGWYNIHFRDTLVGWRSKRSVFQKTTDGGLSWTTLLEVSTGNPDVAVSSFSILGEDIIWGVDRDANILYPNFQFRGVIAKSTNAGLNWGYQLPDTSFRMPFFVFCEFVNTRVGWAYNSVHTLTGGDTTTYPLTSVSNQSTNVASSFILYQNYPNPFNPKTTIEYDLKAGSNVMLKVTDINGREVRTLVNSRQHPGRYK